MCLVWVRLRNLVSVSPGNGLGILRGKPWHLHQSRENLTQVWIWTSSVGEQLPQVVHGSGDALDKMLLPLEITPESVCPKDLQNAEQDA